MKCFITGGTGFIGSYVVKKLVEKGHEVVVLQYSNDNSRWLDELINEEEKRLIKFVQGDINDYQAIRQIIINNDCEYIIHLASKLNRLTRLDPVGGVQTNTLAFQNLLEICKEEKIKKIVWASSSAVYGVGEDRRERYGDKDVTIMDEDTPLCPGSLYSYCKVFNEGISDFYRNEYGIDSVGLRVNLTYGPYIQTSFEPFFSSIIDGPAVEKDCQVPFADTLFDFQYAEDLADAFLATLLAPKTKTGIFVTRGDLRPVTDAIKFIIELFPNIKISPLAGDMDIPLSFNTQLFEKEIGYKPAHTMEQGMLKSINMVRKSNGLSEVVDYKSKRK